MYERWILSRANHTVAEVTRLLEGFQFGEAGRIIQDFTWNEFCDWYLELAKISLRAGSGDQNSVRHTLLSVLETILKLLHPFMPFVTEAIWRHLPARESFLMVASWPEVGNSDEEIESEIGSVIEVIRAIET